MTLIAQITDPHLRDDGAYPCHDPATTMRVAFRQIAALDLRPEAILLTGDIIDRSAQGYAHTLALLKEATVPLLPMPGNHDRPTEFRATFAGWAEFALDHLSFSARVGGLLLVALDSTLPDGLAGLDRVRLDWLAGLLATAVVPVLLALHHPPFPTFLPHLERGGFQEADRLATLIRKSTVCRIIAGHSHRSIHTQWAGVQASTAAAIGSSLTISLSGTLPHRPLCTTPSFELHQVRGNAAVIGTPELSRLTVFSLWIGAR